MMEYYFIYDKETGEVLMRGSGVPGTLQEQQLAEGLGGIEVTQAIASAPGVDLEGIKDLYKHKIDSEAESVRQLFITSGSGQALEYRQVQEELSHYDLAASIDPSDYPFVNADATARGISLEDSMNEVRQARYTWIVIGAAIRAARLKAKDLIADATSIPEIVDAASIDWQEVVG